MNCKLFEVVARRLHWEVEVFELLPHGSTCVRGRLVVASRVGVKSDSCVLLVLLVRLVDLLLTELAVVVLAVRTEHVSQVTLALHAVDEHCLVAGVNLAHSPLQNASFN